MDTAFLQGVKKFFRIGEEIKELVDPYFLMNFAGKEVQKHYKNCYQHNLRFNSDDRGSRQDKIMN